VVTILLLLMSRTAKHSQIHLAQRTDLGSKLSIQKVLSMATTFPEFNWKTGVAVRAVPYSVRLCNWVDASGLSPDSTAYTKSSPRGALRLMLRWCRPPASLQENK
jgi:hypothetical protein